MIDSAGSTKRRITHSMSACSFKGVPNGDYRIHWINCQIVTVQFMPDIRRSRAESFKCRHLIEFLEFFFCRLIFYGKKFQDLFTSQLRLWRGVML